MSEVKFNIKLNIDGKEHLVSASIDAKTFANNLSEVQTTALKLQKQLLKYSNITNILV